MMLALARPHLHDEVMVDVAAVPAWETLTEEQRHRWTAVLDHVAAAVPAGVASVVIDGPEGYAAVVADRLAVTLRDGGRVTVAVADGPDRRARPPAGGWDVVVWLRTPPGSTGAGDGSGGDGADVVIDLQDPAWPVLRHLAPRLAAHDHWYLTESRAFFAAKAATWDARFGDDLPAYAAAVADAEPVAGGVAIDVGCGTGRALPALRAAVGPDGLVLGLDLTPQMLAAARPKADAGRAGLVLADARFLPLAGASVDAVFAAGLLTHLPDTDAGLRELARVTRPGGRLALFHPSGRAALAARHGRTVRPDDPLNEEPLRQAAARTGWELIRYDDPPHRFLAVAVRR
jgi:SAM-dependent methyltransferase